VWLKVFYRSLFHNRQSFQEISFKTIASQMFIPNGTKCSGVEQFNANRPLLQENNKTIMIVLTCSVITLFLGTIPFLWKFKNATQFGRLRPFVFNVLYCILFSAICACALLVNLYEVPCVVLLAFHVVGGAATVTFLFMKSFVFILEHHFVQRVNTANSILQNDVLRSTSLLASMRDFYNVSIGSPVERLSLENIARLRAHKLFIGVVVFSIPLLAFGVAVVCMDILHLGCVNCTIFVEFVIVVMAAPGLILILLTRFVLISSKIGSDSGGVFNELKLITIFVGSVVSFVYLVLMTLDPWLLMYTRIFDWEFINIAVAGPLSWLIFFAKPLRTAFSQQRARLGANNRIENKENFLEKMDDATKASFVEYCKRHYCIESINFLASFKVLTDSLQQLIVGQRIKQTFVHELGLQSINVSDVERKKAMSSPVNAVIFDGCELEVVAMLQSGTLLDFFIERKKNARVAAL
jgi:hypothetical protein